MLSPPEPPVNDLPAILLASLLTCLIGGLLLSAAVPYFFPTFYLSFWQWCVVAGTIRFFCSPAGKK